MSKNMDSPTIGIVGGMGPFAGLDVNEKIFKHTIAKSDKDHINVVCLSLCQNTPDRTQYLLGQTTVNPGSVMAKKICNYPLDVVGIACNTFHAFPIFDAFQKTLNAHNEKIQILNLTQEVKKFAEKRNPNSVLGVLCTLGTFEAQVYQNVFKGSTVKLKFLNSDWREAIHNAIYHPSWGIKQNGFLSKEAKDIIEEAIDKLIELDVDGILLACTELPIVFHQIEVKRIDVIDVNTILARALINTVNPDLLKEVNLY